jgi:Rrf2 family protein
MRLSHKSDYGLRALLALSRLHGEERPASIREIAHQENIPEKFLVQILFALKMAGLLRCRMGMHGGYLLAKPPEEITFADVIRVLEGSLAPSPCVDKALDFHCPEENGCGVRGVMREVHEAVEQVLNHTTLADACHGHESVIR